MKYLGIYEKKTYGWMELKGMMNYLDKWVIFEKNVKKYSVLIKSLNKITNIFIAHWYDIYIYIRIKHLQITL